MMRAMPPALTRVMVSPRNSGADGGDDGGADAGPHGVGDADGHLEFQRPRQQREGGDVADHHDDRPQPVGEAVAEFQRGRGEHLGHDGSRQENPRHSLLPPSSGTFRGDTLSGAARSTGEEGRMRVLLGGMRWDAPTLHEPGPARPRVERQAITREFGDITCYEVAARTAIEGRPGRGRTALRVGGQPLSRLPERVPLLRGPQGPPLPRARHRRRLRHQDRGEDESGRPAAAGAGGGQVARRAGRAGASTATAIRASKRSTSSCRRSSRRWRTRPTRSPC